MLRPAFDDMDVAWDTRPYDGNSTTLNRAASSDGMGVLNYKDNRDVCTACPGPINSVRYQWQGDHVEMLDPAPPA